MSVDDVKELLLEPGMGWVGRAAGPAAEWLSARSVWLIDRRSTSMARYETLPFELEPIPGGFLMAIPPGFGDHVWKMAVSGFEFKDGKLVDFRSPHGVSIGLSARRFRSVCGEWVGWSVWPIFSSMSLLVVRADRLDEMSDWPLRHSKRDTDVLPGGELDTPFGVCVGEHNTAFWLGRRRNAWLGLHFARGAVDVGVLGVSGFRMPSGGGRELEFVPDDSVLVGDSFDDDVDPMDVMEDLGFGQGTVGALKLLALMTRFYPSSGVSIVDVEDPYECVSWSGVRVLETSGVAGVLEALRETIASMKRQLVKFSAFGLTEADLEVRAVEGGVAVRGPSAVMPVLIAAAHHRASVLLIDRPSASFSMIEER